MGYVSYFNILLYNCYTFTSTRRYYCERNVLILVFCHKRSTHTHWEIFISVRYYSLFMLGKQLSLYLVLPLKFGIFSTNIWIKMTKSLWFVIEQQVIIFKFQKLWGKHCPTNYGTKSSRSRLISMRWFNQRHIEHSTKKSIHPENH